MQVRPREPGGLRPRDPCDRLGVFLSPLRKVRTIDAEGAGEVGRLVFRAIVTSGEPRVLQLVE